jgi:ABC-2 type transport system ATP-binding protein
VQATVREFVRSYADRFGATVMLTSHYMQDVEALCSRVVVIDGGNLQYDGDLAALVARSRPEKEIALRFTEAVAAEDLEKFGNVKSRTDLTAHLLVPRAEAGPVVAALLAQLPVADLTVDDPPLEEVMRQLFDRTGK